MATKRRQLTNDYKGEFVKIIDKLSGKYNRFEVLNDFLQMSFIALANRIYQSDKMEEEYLATVKKYSSEEQSCFAELLGLTAIALEERNHDFLGECFMMSDQGNKYKGQFFTPYSISYMMATMTLSNAKDIVEKEGFIHINEPACGSSGMIIASDEALKELGINDRAVYEVQDVDRRCYYMSYIQLTLLDIPAKVVLGNTLTLEVNEVAYTLAYARDDWFTKISERNKANHCDDFAKTLKAS